MPDDIVLIGPINTGKSTQGELLAAALDLPQCPMDEHRWDYYAEIGYDKDFAERLGKHVGFWAVYMYWKEFECYAVERLLAEHRDCVIDFGAGHSVYEIDSHFKRAKAALKSYPNVVLLLPAADRAESLRLLNERAGKTEPDPLDINEHFIGHRSNYDLARHIVYTDGKAPEETRDEILERVRVGDRSD